MGVRESYENGVFNWVDLMTTAPDSAKSFYGTLFGWTFEDRPVPDAPPYSMAFKGDRPVAALFAMPDEKVAQKIPPHWQTYINVDNLETALEKCQTYGGKVIVPPCEIMEAGRMAVVQDPSGAFVNLWQAKAHIGAGVVNEVNTLCWTELQTWDADKAATFYQSVFDWQTEKDEKPPHYVTCSVNNHLNCGIFDMAQTELPRNIPARWAVYVNVENLDASMEQVKQLGGKVLMDAIAIEPGRFTTIIDPQGAALSIMELIDPDD